MSFRLKLFLSISLLIAFTFGTGGILLISTSFQTTLNEEKKAAIHSFETVQNTLYLLNSVGEKTDYNNMSDALKQMERQNMAQWQALYLKSEEHLVYQSGDQSLLSADLPLPESGQCSYMILSDEQGYCLQILSSIYAGEEQLLLKARFDLSSAYDSRRTQQYLYLVIYAAVVLLGMLLACILSVILTKRLRKLAITVRQISGGDLSRRSSIKTYDEFGQLSRDFDAMADKLQENISKLENDMQRQESFMGAFAHELKTPMTSIIGYADLLRQGALDEDDRIMAADYIFTEGQRLEKLSFKLLDLLLTEKDLPTMKEIHLSTFLSDIEKALSPSLQAKNIRLLCKGEHIKVVLEPDLVKSLLYNLIDNASKAIESEGTIAVKGVGIPGGCELRVMDNGQGMDPSELSKITEAFYRIDKSRSRQQGGAGLGLALCKKITELHHGNIAFRSKPGFGTCVTVELYAGRDINANTEI